MELKNIILPVGVLIVALIILGIVTLTLTWNINEKVTKLSDMNSSIFDLNGQIAVLSANNLQINTNYNNLLATYNTTSAALQATQTQVTTLSSANNTLISEKASLASQIFSLSFDINRLTVDNNRLSFDNNTVAQLRLDNNKLKIDLNILGIDRNQLYFITNDYNARAHRLYTYSNTCYWSAKCSDTNNTICALKYGYIDINSITGHSPTALLQAGILRSTCISTIDNNINDFNYFG
jgi:uncharacterized protein YoxC